MNVLVVSCHPLPESFTAATTARVLCALSGSGRHTLRHRDLYADPVLADPVLADLRWCNAIVLVYPTWWSGQPAMLTGWLQSVLAMTIVDGAGSRPLRNIRRIAAVTSHGSSKLVNVAQGEGGKRVLSRGLRRRCRPLTRMSWIALYGIDRSSRTKRQRFLEHIERRFARW